MNRRERQELTDRELLLAHLETECKRAHEEMHHALRHLQRALRHFRYANDESFLALGLTRAIDVTERADKYALEMRRRLG